MWEVMMATLHRSVSRDASLSTGANIDGNRFFLFLFLDFIFTQTVINLLSTASWRGVWNLLDLAAIRLFGSLSSLPGLLASSSLGVFIHLVIYLISPMIDKLLLHLDCPLHFLLSRLFTTIYFTASMLLWSSFWNLFELMFTTNFHLLLCVFFASILLLACGCFNTVNGVPATLSRDWEGGCLVDTLLQGADTASLPAIHRWLWRAADAMATVLLEVRNVLPTLLMLSIQVVGVQAWYGAETFFSGQIPAPPQVSLQNAETTKRVLGLF